MRLLNNYFFARALAIFLVLIPAIIVVALHTSAAPEFLIARTDAFMPGDPQFLFNDITPSDKTRVISLYEGVRVRPVVASPVYLLFQPRVHTKKIMVEMVARSNIATHNSIQMGYRTADGPEHNVLTAVEGSLSDDGWRVWRTEIPFEKMYKEKIDARRIVLSFPHANKETWMIRSIRIRYE